MAAGRTGDPTVKPLLATDTLYWLPDSLSHYMQEPQREPQRAGNQLMDLSCCAVTRCAVLCAVAASFMPRRCC
jgi:hypothetical protein